MKRFKSNFLSRNGVLLGVFTLCLTSAVVITACKKSGEVQLSQTPASETSPGKKGENPTTSSLIWYGDPAQSASSVFKLIGTGNVESPSTISTSSDATRGTVWKFDKPSGSNRCENHGIKVSGSGYTFNNNTVYYFGWWTKLTNNADNNAIFQWKSYGTGHQQNFPVVLKMIGGKLSLMHTAPGGVSTIIWQGTFNSNTWYQVALCIRVDDNASEGYVEFWFNGTKQTFNTGSQRYYGRTYDVGNHNCPKWGIYGRSDLSITNYMDELRIGTSYADVD